MEQVCVERLDHLGVLASVIKDLGLIDMINARLVPDEQEAITPGEAVAGLILNGLGFANRPWSLTPQFFHCRRCTAAAYTHPVRRSRRVQSVKRGVPTMPITQSGYAVGRGIFSPAEIQQMQTSITETINRIAHGFLTPYEISLPELPFEERLERVAHQDRAYTYALLHGVFADAQRDPRIAGLAAHPRLMEHVNRLVAPRPVTGQVIRVRVNIPSFQQKRSPWHQDTTDHRSAVTMACWIPLVDATQANGTLEVIPGACDAPALHQQTEDGKFYIPQDALPDTPPVTLPCPAGDVLFLDRFLPHRTLPNQTTKIRWNVVMWVKCGPD